MNIIINHNNFPLVYFHIVSFCVIILSSLLCSYFCIIPAFVFFFFLLPEKETDMTDLSLACIQPCPCQSLNGRLSTDLVESYVFPLVSSNPVPAGRVCPPGPPPHVPAAQICSPVSPRPCPQGTTPVPVTHVRHGVFLIPLPAVLDSLKSLRSLCLHPLPAHVMLHPFSQSHHGTHFTVSSSPRPRTVHVFLLAGAELTLGRDIHLSCQVSE